MKEPLRQVLQKYAPSEIEHNDGAAAAVMVLLYDHLGEPHVVLQKRSELVLHHKGQISFPGGAADHTDPTLEFTALRETHEELGVHPDHIDVLGRIDDIFTISNFRVRPYVGWLERYPYDWVYPEVEVAYLLEVPMSHLLDPANFVDDRRVVDGREHSFPAYRFGDDLIWGATARMLTNFLDLWRLTAHA